jgi:hypothetical protein
MHSATLSTVQTVGSRKVGLLVNGGLERIRTEWAVTYSEVLSRYLREHNYAKSHSECTVSGRRYEPGPSGIKITNANCWTITFGSASFHSDNASTIPVGDVPCSTVFMIRCC